MTDQIIIPCEFTMPDKYVYPPNNKEIFEDYFIRTYHENQSERIFLPIAWSSYQRRAAYGKDAAMIRSLQKWFNKLPRGNKYFIVTTWDDGPLVDFADLDIKVFAASGPRIDYPIPLLCNPHPYVFPKIKKDIEISFIGALTHKIRFDLVNLLHGKKGIYISSHPHQSFKFCEILARSKYVLCPRGYGQTSFRICEAIQYGAIPVYISDDYVIPYNDLKNWENFEHPLLSKAETKLISGCYPKKTNGFNYEYCRNKILQNL